MDLRRKAFAIANREARLQCVVVGERGGLGMIHVKNVPPDGANGPLSNGRAEETLGIQRLIDVAVSKQFLAV